jgi:hypothetical protein
LIQFKQELAEKVKVQESDLIEYQDNLDKVAVAAKNRDVVNGDELVMYKDENEELYEYIENLE